MTQIEFEHTLLKTRTKMLRVATDFFRNDEDAEDIVQEVYERMLRRGWQEEDGLYHILTLNSKGVHWVPRDWASLKSYINGEKVYIKGMEPKETKK